MHDTLIVEKTIEFVKKALHEAESGHDWLHIERVYNNAMKIAADEPHANLLIIKLGALLHDIADAKFHNGNEDIGPEIAKKFLGENKVEPNIINVVLEIIRKISFKNSLDKESNDEALSIELKILQDADKLDAIGAIGIARAFSYGGYKLRPFYDKQIAPNLSLTKEEYKKSTAPTINHFYEKLLLLKDMMHTQTGKKMAEERHQFMLTFLEQFYNETEFKI